MKKSKRLLSLFLALVLLLSVVCLPAAAEGTPITSFAVNPYGNGADAVDTVHWYLRDGVYYLLLPTDVNLAELTVYYTAQDTVYVGETPLTSGAATNAFARSGEYTLSCGDSTYTLCVLQSSNLPAVYISTESGNLDAIHANKSHKETGTIRIYEDGECTVDKELDSIKGRGNWSWGQPKKPYNIKFDKKTSVLGMPKAKKWTLLANYDFDRFLMKNAFGFSLANDLGRTETSSFRHIDLYINGNYMGNYMIVESIEVGDGRVEITDLEGDTEDLNPDTDLEDFPAGGDGRTGGYRPGSMRWMDIPNNPENITGGYILEFDYYDRYLGEACGFISQRGTPIVLNSPEYASEAQVKYIAGYWQEAEDALFSETGYNELGKHYTEYFDMETLVNVYLVQEMTKNVDAGITSFYFYKDADGKLKAGPVWDFDNGLGSGVNILDIFDPSRWYTNVLYRNDIDGTCLEMLAFYAELFKRDDFRAAVKTRWQEVADEHIGEKRIEDLNAMGNRLADSAVMNALRWNTYNTTDPAALKQAYLNDVASLIQFISNRKSWLDKGFGDDAVYVRYEANGGIGRMRENHIYSTADTITIQNCGFSNPGYAFEGWNTEPDGSGTAYVPGSKVTLPADMTRLWAQWGVDSTETVDFTKALSYQATATANANVSGEGPELAVDGNVRTKWCSTVKENDIYWLEVDLGRACVIDRWVVLNAGDMENASLITDDFSLQIQKEDGTWETVDTVTDNMKNLVISDLATPVTASKARLVVPAPGNPSDPYARIYEFHLFGKTAVSEDQAAADAVIALIDAIGEVTLESEVDVEAAREAYDALTEAQKALVTNAEDLTIAEETLAELVAADKALADAIADAKALNADDYTEETWVILTEALEAAEALSEDAATVDKNAAAEALSAAVTALVEKADLTALEAAIAAAETLLEDDYTAESWAAMKIALEAAKALDAKDAQVDVDAATATLTEAVAGLVQTSVPAAPIVPVHPVRPIIPVIGGVVADEKGGFPFVDVPANAWFYDEVKEAWENDLINGVTEKLYKPEETLTVAQAIKLAAALHQMYFEGKVTLENGTPNWYDSYVDYAIYNGIIEAKYDNYTTVQMNAAISREEFVHIFYGAMPISSYYACNNVADNAIPDVKMNDTYADEIYTFYRTGILTGSDAQGTFNPESSIRRSECAAILIRMYDYNTRITVMLK